MSETERRLCNIERDVAEILRLQRLTLKGELIIMSTQAEIDAAVAQLSAEVAKETTVEQSAIALMNGIGARVDAAVAAFKAANPGLDVSALTAVSATIAANRDALAAAVASNTAADPTNTPAPADPAPAPAPAT